MTKPKVTRTYGPIHFEDLDPHRFEDLVRELIYDYKDWQCIEATGRSGSDEGFDIRAYEKVEITNQNESEDGKEVEEIHPMEGNLWMIQGKREKQISPAKVKSILSDIDIKNPPYGYILAASSNFSKKSYDVFREELRKKKVMEFYLWGNAELEDMLHLPKNDRILFTFFGVSLVSKHRLRTTEIRSAVTIKNKLYRIVEESHQFYQSILIRDLKDIHYPYKFMYKDFEKKPRWKEYVAFESHPLGLLCHNHEYYAYLDTKKKEWDITKEFDFVHPQGKYDDEYKSMMEKKELVRNTWEFFPRTHQAHFIVDCIVKYKDIMLVDDKGDKLYDFPHIYVDFIGEKGPFANCFGFFKIGEKLIDLTEEYKRIKIFPDKFQVEKFGKIYKNKKIKFNTESLNAFKEGSLDVLYESDKIYEFLKLKDVIYIANTAETNKKTNLTEDGEDEMVQITYKFRSKIKDYLSQARDDYRTRGLIQLQLGREIDENEVINIYEFKRVYKWQLEKRKNI